MDKLFTEYEMGNFILKNRVVMAPMTRSRATQNHPNNLMKEYYYQRTEAGLIITEGTSPSPNGLGYPRIPACYSLEHVEAWKKITKSVHKKGSKIFLQLMHTGRVSHDLNIPRGGQILAPSAIAAPGKIWTDQKGELPFDKPREMSENDIEYTINEFAMSATYAMEAEFDGVEIHAAHGYLIDQFLNTASNHRADRWGGNLENRIRFAVEVTKACSKAIGADRIGISLSPYGNSNGMVADDEIDLTYTLLAKKLNALNICYLHYSDVRTFESSKKNLLLKTKIRNLFTNTMILSGGYNQETGERALANNRGDLIAFGKPFISNPKLVTKMKHHQHITEPDPSTYYTVGSMGYIDYH